MSDTASPSGKRMLFLASDAHGAGGGIAQYNRDILGALDADMRLAHITVFARNIEGDVGITPAKVTYQPRAATGIAAYARCILGALVTGDRHDIVYCAHIHLLPFALLCSGIWRVPLLLAIYGIDAWQPPSSRVPWVWNRSIDRLVTISRVTMRRFQSWSGFDDAKVAVVPNAIDLDALTPGPKAADLLDHFDLGDGPVLMTFGRMSASERYKGFDEVMAILPDLRARYPGLRYLLCGDGDDRARLEQETQRLGVADLCRFTGFVPADRKADYYRLADAYVMPSNGEGFGFVVIEAMACGIPVVASVSDGTYEAVREGELGIAVDPSDRLALIDAVIAALGKPRGVPAGLSYFAEPHFSARVSAALDGLL